MSDPHPVRNAPTDWTQPRHVTGEQALHAIVACFERGLYLHAGPHSRVAVAKGEAKPGYFAVFYDQTDRDLPTCDECEEPQFDWTSTQHGSTLADAILNARDAALREEKV